MTGDIFLSLFIAIPIVLLTAAFVFHIERRRADMDQMERRDEEATGHRMGPGAPRAPRERGADEMRSNP